MDKRDGIVGGNHNIIIIRYITFVDLNGFFHQIFFLFIFIYRLSQITSHHQHQRNNNRLYCSVFFTYRPYRKNKQFSIWKKCKYKSNSKTKQKKIELKSMIILYRTVFFACWNREKKPFPYWWWWSIDRSIIWY